VEPHHGTSIFAVTVFDFDQSEVGEYGEVVYAVIVPPLVREGRLPKSAFFPWQVATTTKAAREHAIERWHLPHWMDDVEVELVREKGRTTAKVKADGAPALDLTSPSTPGSRSRTCTSRSSGTTPAATWRTSSSRARRASTRRRREDRPPRPRVQQGRGRLRGLRDPVPELWMRNGCQLFDPLAKL